MIDAKVVSHDRHATLQIAEAAVPPQMFTAILSLIAGVRERRATA